MANLSSSEMDEKGTQFHDVDFQDTNKGHSDHAQGEHYAADEKHADNALGKHHHGKHGGLGRRSESEIARIDAIALAEGTTMESFAHLDKKKILRKMDMRLIPMLAALYLLSFLDRVYNSPSQNRQKNCVNSLLRRKYRQR